MFSCGRREDIPDERHREKNERDDLENNKMPTSLRPKKSHCLRVKDVLPFQMIYSAHARKKNKSHEKHSIAAKTLYCHALTLRVRGPAQPLRCRKTHRINGGYCKKPGPCLWQKPGSGYFRLPVNVAITAPALTP